MQVFISPCHSMHSTDAFPRYPEQPVLELPCRIELLRSGLARVLPGTECEPSDFGVEVIERVHTPEFVSFLRGAFDQRCREDRTAHWAQIENLMPHYSRRRSSHPSVQSGRFLTDTYTQIFAGTFEAAYWSAQTTVSAAQSILMGSLRSYALVRPPGHHAYADQAGGFCFLNNAAIAARHLQTVDTYRRICILDIDFHHGNGTQEIFYSDPSVLFCSLHGHPDFAYPYFSGDASERGAGDAEGTNVNIPLAEGTRDDEYVSALESILPVIRKYAPGALIVSLGFDAAEGDPYGGFRITPDGFRRIGRIIRDLRLPTLLVQEGGYLLDRLADNSEAFFRGLVA